MNENERNYPVKKSNEIIQSCECMLSSQEFDLLNYLVMKIKDDDFEIKEQEISLKDYCEIMGIQQSGRMYEKVRKSAQGLADKSRWYIDGDYERLVRWIDDPILYREGGTIILELKKYWQPHLTALKERYTVTTLKDIVPMESVYGKRLYELLLSYQFDKEKSFYKEFELDDLKKLLLGVFWDKKYKAFKDFRIKVIEPALRDMHKYGSLNVSVEYRKMGRSYKYINFIVQRKDYRKLAVAGKNSEQYFSTKTRKDTKNGKKID